MSADNMQIEMLSPGDVAAKIASNSDALILDVRDEDEWETHHIDVATLIPTRTLALRLPELDRNRETIVICEHGVRSLSVAKYLVSQAGFTRVGNMVGGMAAWIEFGGAESNGVC